MGLRKKKSPSKPSKTLILKKKLLSDPKAALKELLKNDEGINPRPVRKTNHKALRREKRRMDNSSSILRNRRKKSLRFRIGKNSLVEVVNPLCRAIANHPHRTNKVLTNHLLGTEIDVCQFACWRASTSTISPARISDLTSTVFPSVERVSGIVFIEKWGTSTIYCKAGSM